MFESGYQLCFAFYFPKRPSGAPLHTLSKLYDVPVGFVTPPPYFETEYCLFCGRRRVAVARYRMICLVLFNHTVQPILLYRWESPRPLIVSRDSLSPWT